MTSVRAQAVDLHERWLERDHRYALSRRLIDDNLAVLIGDLRAEELADLEDAAAEAGALVDLHRSATYRELRTMLDGWRR